MPAASKYRFSTSMRYAAVLGVNVIALSALKIVVATVFKFAPFAVMLVTFARSVFRMRAACEAMTLVPPKLAVLAGEGLQGLNPATPQGVGLGLANVRCPARTRAPVVLL